MSGVLPDLPEVPGFVVLGPDPWGSDQDRVAALEEGSRRRVALRLMPPLYPPEREQMRATLSRYAAVRHEHLGAPVELADDADVLVLPLPERATLARLEEPPASSGQVVTALAPVAQALAALHEAGLAHGEVGADVVGVDDQGRPMLMGAGVQAALHDLAPREIPAPDPAADVAALVDLARAQAARCPQGAPEVDAVLDDVLLTSDVTAPVLAARLLEAVEPEPLGAREDATVAAPEVAEPEAPVAEPELPGEPEPVAEPALPGEPVPLAEPEPLTEPEPLAEPEPQPPAEAESPAEAEEPAEGERWGLVRRYPWLVGVVPLVVVAVVVLLVRGGGDDTEEVGGATRPDTATVEVTPTAEPTGPVGEASTLGTEVCGAPEPLPEDVPPVPDDWATVVRDLYTTRAAALVTGQNELLCDVYDPRSPGLVDDLRLDQAYADQGVRPDRLVFEVQEVTLLSQEGALVTVEVTDRLEPYSLVGPDGAVVAELPGIPPATWQARLVPDATGQEWRFG